MRELLLQELHQGYDALLVVLVEYYDNHNLACRGGADYYVAHQSCVLAAVVERITVVDAELLYGLADRVRRLGLQVAIVDIQYLVKAVGYVSSISWIIGWVGMPEAACSARRS